MIYAEHKAENKAWRTGAKVICRQALHDLCVCVGACVGVSFTAAKNAILCILEKIT